MSGSDAYRAPPSIHVEVRLVHAYVGDMFQGTVYSDAAGELASLMTEGFELVAHAASPRGSGSLFVWTLARRTT